MGLLARRPARLSPQGGGVVYSGQRQTPQTRPVRSRVGTKKVNPCRVRAARAIRAVRAASRKGDSKVREVRREAVLWQPERLVRVTHWHWQGPGTHGAINCGEIKYKGREEGPN